VPKSTWPSSMIGSIREGHERRGPSAKLRLPRAYGHRRHSSRESYIMIIGYGHGNGVRRRGSITPTISDAWGDDSALSSTRSRL
ncbi:hypothetical protein K443DRAFT_36819, partial [Laccaria amethystina LaAM-08-1]